MGKEQTEQSTVPNEVYDSLSLRQKVDLESNPIRRVALRIAFWTDESLLYMALGLPPGVGSIDTSAKEPEVGGKAEETTKST